MNIVLQRVKKAAVTIEKDTRREMGPGLVLLLGVHSKDGPDDVRYLVQKVIHLRIFNDEKGLMNKSLVETFSKPECLIISNFTVYGDCRKGRRPSFVKAAAPEKADELYQMFLKEMKNAKIGVINGVFGAHMEIELVNDGPVTLILNSDHLHAEENE